MTAIPYRIRLGTPRSSLNTREALINEVRRGLLGRPRSLAPWMFYDARGSRIFERITQLPEYYCTRTERDILARFGDGDDRGRLSWQIKAVRLVELGAGTASKTAILLEAAARLRSEVLYVPVDVSPDALDVACESIATSLPEVCISADGGELRHSSAAAGIVQGNNSWDCTSVQASATSRPKRRAAILRNLSGLAASR